MNILVMDGHGGKMGRQLVENILLKYPNENIMAVGTNSIATSAMIKGGAKYGATGENPTVIACRKADIIVGPIGIVIADSLYGEITPKMALAVAQADAVRILIPVNKCDNLIAGASNISLSDLLEDVDNKLSKILDGTLKEA